MKKAYLFVAPFAILLVGAGIYFVSAKEPTKNKTEPTAISKPEVEPKKEVIAQKAKEPATKKPVITKSSEKIYNIKEKQIFSDSFEHVDVEEMKTKMKPKPKVEPMGAYIFKKDSIKGLFVGDSLVLPEINGQEYTLKTESTKANSNGSVTVKSSIEGQEGSYAIMTEGEKTSFIAINTSEGVYELETLNGNGYIYSSADMRNAMIDFSKTDEILPPKDNQVHEQH